MTWVHALWFTVCMDATDDLYPTGTDTTVEIDPDDFTMTEDQQRLLNDVMSMGELQVLRGALLMALERDPDIHDELINDIGAMTVRLIELFEERQKADDATIALMTSVIKDMSTNIRLLTEIVGVEA